MVAQIKSYNGAFVSDLLSGMTCASWSHEFVVDGTAFYVPGSLTRMHTFLLVMAIPPTESR